MPKLLSLIFQGVRHVVKRVAVLMTAYLGTISEFSTTQESWTVYVEHLVQYLAANKIEEQINSEQYSLASVALQPIS